MYTWHNKLEWLLELALEMRADKEILSCNTEILIDERDRFISLIPDEVPPVCKELIKKHLIGLYEQQTTRTKSLKGHLIRIC